jgi:hypothetical protein
MAINTALSLYGSEAERKGPEATSFQLKMGEMHLKATKGLMAALSAWLTLVP